jgi:hypothetical protein
MTFLAIDVCINNSYIIKVVLRFNSWTVINTEKSKLHSKITRTMRDAAAAALQNHQRCCEAVCV